MEEEMTVDYMLEYLQKLSDAGKGDMKIKCNDNFVHCDEIGCNYLTNEVLIHGNIYNFDMTQKVKEFCRDIEIAKRKFYGLEADDLDF